MRLTRCFVILALTLTGCQKLASVSRLESASDDRSGPSSSLRNQSANSTAHIGNFSNMTFTSEHQYGAEVQLWRAGGEVVGLFSYSEGLAGDTPAGMLQNVVYNQQTGVVSFEAKLTTAQHLCKEHNGTPSRDLFQFEGSLKDGLLTGVLRQLDALHDNRLFGDEQKVELARNKHDEPLQTYNEWMAETQMVLRFRGPKW